MDTESFQAICPLCGKAAKRTLSGHLEHLECESCEWSQDSTVITADEVRLLDENPKHVAVYIEWTNGHATPKEVMTARRVVDSLSKHSFQELLAIVRGKAQTSLGFYPLPQAIELQERMKPHGIRVVFQRKTD